MMRKAMTLVTRGFRASEDVLRLVGTGVGGGTVVDVVLAWGRSLACGAAVDILERLQAVFEMREASFC